MNKLEKERLKIVEVLTKECNARGYKTSFEDEGASLEDMASAKNITEKCRIKIRYKNWWMRSNFRHKASKNIRSKSNYCTFSRNTIFSTKIYFSNKTSL